VEIVARLVALSFKSYTEVSNYCFNRTSWWKHAGKHFLGSLLYIYIYIY